MGTSAHNTDAQWSELTVSRPVVANLKAFDPDVTLVMNRQYGAPAVGRKMLGVEDGCLAGIASKSDVPIRRVAGCLDAYTLFVDSTPYIDGTARTHGICGMLNSSPRCRLRAGIRIIPCLRHVEGGVGLAKGRGDAQRQHNKRQKFHARPLKKTQHRLQHFSLWLRFYKQISGEFNRQMRIVS